MGEPHDITRMLAGIREGDQRAIEAIWGQYFAQLVNMARRKLDQLPGGAADEEDVAISAMFSFCRGMEAGRFENVDDRQGLWKLLATITARKACKQLRREYAEKRGGGKLRGESVFQGKPVDLDRSPGIAEVMACEPTPDEAIMFVENCQKMLAGLGDQTLRKVAALALEGYSTQEIAERLGCVQRTVERKLERIRTRWSQMEQDEDS